MANPMNHGRRPNDLPTMPRTEIDRRQAGELNASENGTIVDGKVQDFVTPAQSGK